MYPSIYPYLDTHLLCCSGPKLAVLRIDDKFSKIHEFDGIINGKSNN